MSAAVASGFQLDLGTPGTLGVSGVLSFDTAAAAWQAIGAALSGRAVQQLDLAGVSHSDSAGLACILAAAAAGRGLQVVNMPVGMQALAQVCEVERLLS